MHLVGQIYKIIQGTRSTEHKKHCPLISPTATPLSAVPYLYIIAIERQG